MVQEFYSNGKLLLTGEYAILDGAKGLAIPTRFGQNLAVRHSKTGELHWQSTTEKDIPWFTAAFDLNDFHLLHASDMAVGHRLVNILKAAQSLNPLFLKGCQGAHIETHLDFPREWGLGSSSTLINNIANWAQIDPYALLSKTFGGSGYDIACAQHNSPLVYSRSGTVPTVAPVHFCPSFKDRIFFVHLNKKQNSREAIAAYNQLSVDKRALVAAVNELTERMVHCKELLEFEQIMDTHEALLSNTLGLRTLKQERFRGYPGSIKSLGAWGGDFIMATGTLQDGHYFAQKGFPTLIPYSKMML